MNDKDKFFNHISYLIDSWENDSREKTIEGKLEGLAFSILSMLDGSVVDIDPADVIINGENISGGLHEEFFPRRREYLEKRELEEKIRRELHSEEEYYYGKSTDETGSFKQI